MNSIMNKSLIVPSKLKRSVYFRMKRNFNLSVVILLFIIPFISMATPKSEFVSASRVEVLSFNWKMQPVDKLVGTDEKSISQNTFDSKSWYKAIVPGTVLGSWATTGVIKDPYFGINMQEVDYNQFKQPWWFRTTFQLKAGDLKKSVSLRFNGINYRADLWINGKLVAGKDSFAGTYRMFTFNINDYIVQGKNTIALKM